MSQPIGKVTSVVSVRGCKPEDFQHDNDFVYVGRSVPRRGWKASKWRNPFKIDTHPLQARSYLNSMAAYLDIPVSTEFSGPLTARDACVLYRRWALAHFGLRNAIIELKGKTLGCWCGCWEPGQPKIACHAVVLAEAVNAMETRGV